MMDYDKIKAGVRLILEGIGEDLQISRQAREEVEQLLKRSFRPEFLNRLDEIVFYKPLTKTEITGIVELLLADLQNRLRAKQLELVMTPAARDYIVEAGYDPVYGARPLKRLLQSRVETMVAKTIIAQDLAPGTKLTIDCKDGQLVLENGETV